MDTVISIIASAGAWLLLAGPLFQAALELRDETTTRHELLPGRRPVGTVSPWAWLVPPLAIQRHLALRRRFRREQLATMSDDEVRQNVLFSSRATGWLLVAGGAFLIAVKETWEAGERLDVPQPLRWILVVLLLALTTAAAAGNMAWTGRVLLHGGPAGGRRGAARAARERSAPAAPDATEESSG